MRCKRCGDTGLPVVHPNGVCNDCFTHDEMEECTEPCAYCTRPC